MSPITMPEGNAKINETDTVSETVCVFSRDTSESKPCFTISAEKIGNVDGMAERHKDTGKDTGRFDIDSTFT